MVIYLNSTYLKILIKYTQKFIFIFIIIRIENNTIAIIFKYITSKYIANTKKIVFK